jgi:hypothetical protein
MAEYLLIAGTYSEGNARYDVPRGGQPVRVVSDFALDEMHPNQFKAVEGPRFTTDAPKNGEFLGQPAAQLGSREPPVLRVLENTPTPTPQASPPAKPTDEETAADVTAEFPDAAKYGLKVIRRRNGFVLSEATAGRGDAVLTTASSKSQMVRAIGRAAKTRLPVA